MPSAKKMPPPPPSSPPPAATPKNRPRPPPDRVDGDAYVALMIERERQGNCAECAVQTHEFVTGPDGGKPRLRPLTIEGEVHRGRCLFCRPFVVVGRDERPGAAASVAPSASALASASPAAAPSVDGPRETRNDPDVILLSAAPSATSQRQRESFAETTPAAATPAAAAASAVSALDAPRLSGEGAASGNDGGMSHAVRICRNGNGSNAESTSSWEEDIAALNGMPSSNVDGKESCPRSKHDLSEEALKHTQPLYCIASPPMEHNGRHLCSDLEILVRKEVSSFIRAAKNYPSHLWHDSVEASKIFREHLPEYFPDDHARHLFRNFADSPDPTECSCKGNGQKRSTTNRLRISRREMDIMLYAASKGLKTKDCHALMPYRTVSGLQHFFGEIKGDFKDVLFFTEDYSSSKEYMNNVHTAVEAIISLENRMDGESASPTGLDASVSRPTSPRKLGRR